MPIFSIKLPLLISAILISAILITAIGCWGDSGRSNGSPSSDLNEHQSASARSAVVVGSSMGPNFLGEHVSAKCLSCKFHFVAGFLDDPNQNRRSIEDYEAQPLTCPNCGSTRNNHSLTKRPRDNVTITEGKKPKRWSVVAFRKNEGEPQTAKSAGIKRVVGVSGEKINIHGGNLYLTPDDADSFEAIDYSELIRKPLKVQQEMAILIHDTKYADGSERWLKSSIDSDPDMRVFQPRIGYTTNSPRSPAVIEDSYGCNQNLARSLNEMDELLCQFEFSSAPSLLRVSFEMRGRRYAVEVDIKQNRCIIDDLENPAKPKRSSHQGPKLAAQINEAPVVVVSSIDHQLIVAINGQEIAKQPIVVGTGSVSTHPIQFNISKTSSGDTVKINRIRLYRDIYYVSGPLKAGPDGRLAPAILDAKDGYLLIGDNVPLSFDSRHWSEPSVSAERIIGVID